jgi:predicted AlkP superfamily phosphohydrolase/phosphomutase
MTRPSGRKTIVLGLDGATWTVLDPLLAAGRLPNLGGLISRGVRAVCRSTTHPVSPIAWSSIATGTNPGKHGIFDFGRRVPGTYRVETISARLQRGRTLWDVAHGAGLACGVFNVPVTYPPRDCGGFMVTSIFTPSNKVCFTHPAELSAELNALVDGYEFASREVYDPDREDAYVESILATIAKREKALDYLLDRTPIDAGMLVYTESDHIQHAAPPPASSACTSGWTRPWGGWWSGSAPRRTCCW